MLIFPPFLVVESQMLLWGRPQYRIRQGSECALSLTAGPLMRLSRILTMAPVDESLQATLTHSITYLVDYSLALRF